MQKRTTILSELQNLKSGCRLEVSVEAFRNEWSANRINQDVYLAALSGGRYGVKLDSERGVYIFVGTMIHTGR